MKPFKKLDHIAVAVKDTEEALLFYRDRLGLPVVLSEVLEKEGVRLTHLDLGNVHLQLIEPRRPDHPLHRYLEERGEGLHHLCFLVDDVPDAVRSLAAKGLVPPDRAPHRGPRGRQAAFLDAAATRGLTLEVTADRPPTRSAPDQRVGS